jgi:hypothetical protein
MFQPIFTRNYESRKAEAMQRTLLAVWNACLPDVITAVYTQDIAMAIHKKRNKE